MHAWPPQHTTVQCKTVQLFLPSVKLSLPNFSCASQGLTQRRKSLHYLSSKFSPSSTDKRAWGNSSTTWGNKGKKKRKEAWQVGSPKKRKDWVPTAPHPGEIHYNIQNWARSKILSLLLTNKRHPGVCG